MPLTWHSIKAWARVANSTITVYSIQSTMMKLIPSLFLFAFINSTANAEEPAFSSIPDFVATLPKAKLLEAKSSGKFGGGNTIFYAQLVELENNQSQQIFIFRLDESGRYVLVDRSKVMENMGGSGNWKVKNIVFRNSSLYVSVGYWWHQCSGWSENQFRFVNGHLAIIGNESEEENIDEGLTVKSSTNLLTGRGYWISEKNGVVKKHPDNSIGGAQPFSEYDGTGWISPYHAKRRVC